MIGLMAGNLQRGASLAGVVAFVGVATLASNNRPAIPWPTVAWGLGLQLGLGAVILYTEVGYLAFQWLGDGAAHFLAYSDVGAEFVFGAHFTDHYIAFKVLPTIIFFSSFISVKWGVVERSFNPRGSVMYHLGVVQVLVKGVAWVMVKTLDTSVHSVMASGFATVAGGVMVAYMSFGISPVHLISASVMSAPAALAMSKILYPETETPVTQGTVKVTFADSHEVNVIGAAAAGALSGGRLACNVLCILVAFLALIALVNGLLGAIGLLLHVPHLSVEWVLGWLMAPVAWLLGVPWGDCVAVGTLLGKKTVLNEFVAYLDLREMVDQQAISQRAEIIATYALCGFSNFSSMGVQIGGIGGICPERQPDLARLGLRALLAGSLACFLTACVAGLLV
ncbi:Na+ dependent nucleoside transporterlike, putative [Acanthamoeba castellanii str. Neff]|uniref:Na+ dependent nucleoside transporterlike, putative n=1 Tax=Acanthamoeba castellanii (strain ATCC 30010 / Neff) TaxID=1257118 RepID=L8GS32_ACACF|nr:Na+ dependent nucleoside transporterlike, putative [Acanthamoeba castellanii str. Neff]ELR15423.1 Na+ dependent nucleoside transporterlike, putative [Acanthamoeba castellanii str. Neff]